MARTRMELHDILCEIVDHVYFSPPSNLKYPCIKYEEARPDVKYADNVVYNSTNCWILTIIDPDADSQLPKALKEKFQRYLSFDRVYKADNLKHWVYTLYF